MKRGTLKLLVLLASPVASFLLLETVFRCQVYAANEDTLEAAFSVPPTESPDGRVRFCDIIRLHPNDRVIFELRPDLDTAYKGAPLQTNSRGLRSPEVPEAADAGTITIVGIGASNMFGHGVSNEDLYTVHLERLLRERHPSRGWRVINTAVPSYNVVMKVETLKEKGLSFGPDFVLLHVARNNLDLPNYVRAPRDPFALDGSYFLDFFRELRNRKEETRRRYGELAAVDKSQLEWNRWLRRDPSQIPPRYRGLVGWDPFYAALDELVELGDENDFEVLTFAYLKIDINGRLLRQAANRGLHSVCFMDDVIAHLDGKYPGEGFSEQRYLQSDLVVSRTNSHPSPLLHELTAEWVLREMESRGVIERLLATPH